MYCTLYIRSIADTKLASVVCHSSRLGSRGVGAVRLGAIREWHVASGSNGSRMTLRHAKSCHSALPSVMADRGGGSLRRRRRETDEEGECSPECRQRRHSAHALHAPHTPHAHRAACAAVTVADSRMTPGRMAPSLRMARGHSRESARHAARGEEPFESPSIPPARRPGAQCHRCRRSPRGGKHAGHSVAGSGLHRAHGPCRPCARPCAPWPARQVNLCDDHRDPEEMTMAQSAPAGQH